MTIEVVVTRFCEDLSWLEQFPSDWRVTIYDKSEGGPRQRVHLPGWSSADGPDRATLWPGAIPLPNIGTESHTHMHHIIERWDSLAERTAFLSGDGPGHIETLAWNVQQDVQAELAYVPYGDSYTCDRDGSPNAPGLGRELAEAWNLFFDYPMPELLFWHGYSMYLVHRDLVKRFPLSTWRAARAWCIDKRRALAMERLYDQMFG